MKLLTVLFMCVCLSSCATYVGSESLKNHTTESLSKELTKYKTTKPQVTEKFGKPQFMATNEQGKEVWGYALSEIMYGADNRQLMIMFTKSGKVEKYSYIKTQ